MKIPIYSNLKSKLESKGLDSSTSGQIAWLVCSVLISYVLFLLVLILTLIGDSEIDARFLLAFIIMFVNHFFCFGFMWLIFFFNLLYKVNIIPSLLAILQTWLYFYNSYNICLSLIICLILYKINKRLFFTYIISIFYIGILYFIFDLRGGFYK